MTKFSLTHNWLIDVLSPMLALPVVPLFILVYLPNPCFAQTKSQPNGSSLWKNQVEYHLDYKTIGYSNTQIILQEKSDKDKIGSQAQSDIQIEARLRGTLQTRVQAQNGDTLAILFRIKQPDLEIVFNGRTDAERIGTAASQLAKGSIALVLGDGRVLSTIHDSTIDDLSMNYFQSLLGLVQFVLPLDSNSASSEWTTRETDQSGHYGARYRIIPESLATPADEDNKIVIEKRKLGYSRPRSAERSSLSMTIVPKSRMVVTLNQHEGSIIEMAGVDTQKVYVFGRIISRSITTMSLKALRRAATGLDSSCLQPINPGHSLMKTPLFAGEVSKEAEKSIQRVELGKLHFKDLLAALRKADHSSLSYQDETKLFLKLKAFIYLYPDSVFLFNKLLSGANSRAVSFSLIVSALCEVGHSQAQLSVSSLILNRKNDKDALLRIIPLTQAITKPAKALIDLLSVFAFSKSQKSIESMAQLALGTLARNIRRYDTQISRAIVQRLSDSLRKAPDDKHVEQWLLVLGNSDGKEAMAEIAEFTKGYSPRFRSLAYASLRWIDTTFVDSLLLSGLLSEQDSLVRLSIVNVLSLRENDSLARVTQRLAFVKENSISVKIALLVNLWEYYVVDDSILGFVKGIALSDMHSELRELASEKLRQINSQ